MLFMLSSSANKKPLLVCTTNVNIWVESNRWLMTDLEKRVGNVNIWLFSYCNKLRTIGIWTNIDYRPTTEKMYHFFAKSYRVHFAKTPVYSMQVSMSHSRKSVCGGDLDESHDTVTLSNLVIWFTFHDKVPNRWHPGNIQVSPGYLIWTPSCSSMRSWIWHDNMWARLQRSVKRHWLIFFVLYVKVG